MSNYAQLTFFAPKDLLLAGNPAKIIKGADVDPELAAISTAIASKYDALNSYSAPITFADGTAAAPSVTFHSDTTTGFYKSAAGIAAIAASSTLEAGFGGGVVCGAPTGGHKGVGTLNATGLYINGTALGIVTGSANPSATIGLAAVNGTATTFMTSDSAPALSQAISPTWTGNHTFTPGSGAAITVNTDGTGQDIHLLGSSPVIRLGDSGAALARLDLSATNAAVILNSTAGGSLVPMSLRISGTEAIGISTNRNVTIAAPSSGASMAINSLTGQQSIQAGLFSGGTNNPRLYITHTEATGISDLSFTGSTGYSGTLSVGGTAVLKLLGTVAPTLQGYGPTAAALVDMTPDTSTFTATYTGFASPPTATATWYRIGKKVTCSFAAATGTSNSSAFTITGIPAAIRPTTTQVVAIPSNALEDNSVVGPSSSAGDLGGFVDSTGTITVKANGNNAAWATSSGTKGVANQFTVSWLMI